MQIRRIGCRSVSTPTSRRSTPTGSSSATDDEHVEGDGEALLGPAHQPRRRRRRWPRHLREDARPDPRHRAGPPQHDGRHLAWCSPRKAPSTRCTRSCSASASSPCSTTTARSRPPTAPRSRRRSCSSPPRCGASSARRSSTASTLLESTTPITFQVGANTGEAIYLPGSNLGGTYYFASVFVNTFTAGGADIDAIDPALSSIADARATPRRDPEPPRAHDREPRDLPGEPLRRREPHPRHRHGEGDDEVHEAPDPAAVRRRDARDRRTRRRRQCSACCSG